LISARSAAMRTSPGGLPAADAHGCFAPRKHDGIGFDVLARLHANFNAAHSASWAAALKPLSILCRRIPQSMSCFNRPRLIERSS
jgi:hypothetical protein